MERTDSTLNFTGNLEASTDLSLFDENYRQKLIEEIVYWETPQRLSLGPGFGSVLNIHDKQQRDRTRKSLQKLSEEELNAAHAAAKSKHDLIEETCHNKTLNPDFVESRENAAPSDNYLEKCKLTSDDIEYWCSLEYWSIVEFIALSFDLCPHKATSENLRKFRRQIPEPVYQNITRRTEVCRRAHHAHQLQENMKPYKFIEWSKSKNILLPEQIIATLETGRSSLTEAHNPSIIEMPSENHVSKQGNQHKAATARSDTSLYKILYAIAVARYKFDPAKRNSSTPSMILSELEREGLSMDVATIKNHLTKAAEIVKEIKSIS